MAKAIPKEYFDEKFLMTAGGTILAVWSSCAVLSSLLPMNLDYHWWRVIAFLLSIVFSFVFAAKTGTNKTRTIVIILLNAIVIYSGASGVNAMSGSLDLFRTSSKVEVKQASFLPLNEVSWWPDFKLSNEVKKLTTERDSLNFLCSQLRTKNSKDTDNQYIQNKPLKDSLELFKSELQAFQKNACKGLQDSLSILKKEVAQLIIENYQKENSIMHLDSLMNQSAQTSLFKDKFNQLKSMGIEQARIIMQLAQKQLDKQGKYQPITNAELLDALDDIKVQAYNLETIIKKSN